MSHLRSLTFNFQFFICLVCILSATAAAQQWEDVGGPYGGTYIDIISHNDSLVAAPYYRSFLLFGNAEGTRWRRVDMPSPAAEPFCLLSPGGGRLLAGSFGRVYRSDDEGASWSEFYIPDLGGAIVNDMTGENDTLFACGGGTLVRSVDRGLRWTVLTEAPSADAVAMSGSRLLAGGANGLWVSVDAGESWKSTGDSGDVVRQLFVVDGICFAALAQARPSGCTLLRSSTKAESWEETGMQEALISALTQNQGELFAGCAETDQLRPLYRSTTGGMQWEEVLSPVPPLPPPFPRPVRHLFSTGNGMLASLTGMGIWRSETSPLQWEYVTHGHFPVGVADIALDSEGTIYAYSMKENFLARRSENSVTWEFMQYPQNERPGDMLLSRDTIFLAMSDGFLYASVHDGLWSRHTASSISKVWQALYKERQGGRFIGAAPELPPFYSDNVRRHMEQGDWEGQPDTGPDRWFGFAAWNGPFAGMIALSSDGAHRSTDRGASWETFRSGSWYDATDEAAATLLAGEDGLLGLTSPTGPEILLHQEPVYAVAHSAGTVFAAATRDSGIVLYQSVNDIPGTRLLDGLPATGYAPPTVCRIALAWHGNTLYFGNCGLPGLWKYTVADIHTDIRMPQMPPDNPVLPLIYPNPVALSATITMEAPIRGYVRLSIFDHLGRSVRTLHDGTLEYGIHAFKFTAADLPPGMYFIVRQAGKTTTTRPFVVLH